MIDRPAEYTPRPPTDDELAELSVWLMESGAYNRQDADMVARNAYVAVFDHYQTGCPGYCGKVMTVVWDGSPTTFNNFTWLDGKMEEAVNELVHYQAVQS